MNLNITKEEILQFKHTLKIIVNNKSEAVAAQNWEAAAGFRDEEKIIKDYLQTMKSEIRETLKNLKQSAENEKDWIVLEELLLLFDVDADC